MTANDANGDTGEFVTAYVGTNTLISPKAALTYENCKELEETVNACVEQNRLALVLDCKAIQFMDSEALEKLVELHDKLLAKGGDLKIAGLNTLCRDILMVTRLINVFNVYADVPEALRSRS